LTGKIARPYAPPLNLKTSSKKNSVDDRETTERLLDTAERLFAEHGFDGVGMRALAAEAGVNLGAATYHYGSKEALYVEAFMRRFRPTNAERMQLLREAETKTKGKPIPVEIVVECMVRPPFQTVLRYPNFPALLARNLFMPPPFMQQVLHKEMGPQVEVFVGALARALPKIPPDLILLRQIFTMGTVLISAGQFARLPAAVRGNPVFFEYALKELIRYISAALSSAPAVAEKDRPPLPFPIPSR
jgi:AcrR family transcriptional regulator